MRNILKDPQYLTERVPGERVEYPCDLWLSYFRLQRMKETPSKEPMPVKIHSTVIHDIKSTI